MERLKNPKMYKLAKDEGEKAFIEAINNSIYKPIAVSQAFGDDDKGGHYDVKMLEYDVRLEANAWHFVDVKDVEEKNFNTGNYVLRKPFIEFHNELKPYGYYTAFRIVENGKRTKKFILVNTQEMLERCQIRCKGDFYLVSLKDVKRSCDCKMVHEETF